MVSFGASTPMKNCNHEEVDTRVVVHIVHALEQRTKTIQVNTVDTDVVVILASTFHDLIATHPLADFGLPLAWAKITGKPGGAKITSIACIACIFRLQHNLCLQRQGQEVSLAGLACL